MSSDTVFYWFPNEEKSTTELYNPKINLISDFHVLIFEIKLVGNEKSKQEEKNELY